MKRVMFFLMFASLLAYAGCEKPDNPDVTPDTIDDPDTPPSDEWLFSVSDSTMVRFAPGNLEYDEIDGYYFVAHQYDYGGYFGYGTGNNPTFTSTDYRDYPDFDDWGNHIDGGWRTLSADEWCYVLWDRDSASAKYGVATVCGVHGMVLLPDSWHGGAFTPGFDNGWSTNVYDTSLWSDMEDAGAVFLPAAANRVGSAVGNVGTFGDYWSSSPNGWGARSIVFEDGYVYHSEDGGRFYGLSVRLVQDY